MVDLKLDQFSWDLFLLLFFLSWYCVVCIADVSKSCVIALHEDNLLSIKVYRRSMIAFVCFLGSLQSWKQDTRIISSLMI
jgi:hypothetical protein